MPPSPLARPFAPPHTSAAGAGTRSSSNVDTNTPTPVAPALPSLPTLSSFLLSHLPQLSPPAAASEVQWLYHSPSLQERRPKQPPQAGEHQQRESPRPLPSNSSVQRLILSITPTEGMYTALGAVPLPPPLEQPLSDAVPFPITTSAPTRSAIPPRAFGKDKLSTAAFLHRPWTLTRGRLPRGTTVWSSHKAFDEGLTVGCNFELMARLGTDVGGETAKVLVGYKGDEGRRIGVVAGFGEAGVGVEEVRERVKKEFGNLEGEGGWFGLDPQAETTGVHDEEAVEAKKSFEKSTKATAIACMNAFHPAEVDRVAAAAVEAGFASSSDDCSGVLYLTGAVREEGLQAALQKGMRVVCVGHRICEVWGVAFLAERVREKWPGMKVEVVDEEEMKPEPKAKKPVIKKQKQTKHEDRNGNITEGLVYREAKKRRKDDDQSEEDGGVLL